MRLKNDGAESKGISVTRRSRAATIEGGRASFPQHIATVFVITLRVGCNWEGVLKLEPNNGDQAGTQLLEQRYV